MTERPEHRRHGEPVEGDPSTSETPPDPQATEDSGRRTPNARGASSSAIEQEVPVAAGSSTAYTTGTLEPGELGPAVTKPAGEGPTQGEGPVQAVQDVDADEFRESRIDHEP